VDHLKGAFLRKALAFLVNTTRLERLASVRKEVLSRIN
jgi:hypothetical protein